MLEVLPQQMFQLGEPCSNPEKQCNLHSKPHHTVNCTVAQVLQRQVIKDMTLAAATV